LPTCIHTICIAYKHYSHGIFLRYTHNPKLQTLHEWHTTSLRRDIHDILLNMVCMHVGKDNRYIL
jgi:hypothetical protein